MAETYVGAVLEAVLSKVIPITTEHIDLAWGLQDELTRLGDSLEMIKAFLQDAEEGRTKNNLVKLWLQRLKVVAYKADDVLDEFSYEILRRKVEIQDHIGRKSAMDHESHVFGRSNVETISFMDDSNIVGRKSDVSKVVDLLVNPKDDQVVSFVPIVGPGGLGKTTSAKLVYKDVSVERHFDVKTWVCFSNDFDVKRILKEMLDHFPNQRTLISDSMNAIVQKHKEKMEEAKGEKEQIKYLLVLDDVWSVEKCKELKLCLIGICKNGGSGVIVTTRSQGVASAVQAFPSQWHQAGKLEDDECWSIIKERAPRGSPMPRELEFIGREIAKQCQAVPLVAKVIAGTMCNIEKSQDAWMKIETSDVWGSGESVLKLNFDRLSSPSLKKCFAYCAMFPRDYCFEKDQLIQLWMAEGFLGNSMAMVDIGNKYLNELLSYTLFQEVEKDTCGNILTFKMHDLVHNLALSVSKSDTLIFPEYFTLTIDEVSHIWHLNFGCDGEALAIMLTTVTPKLHSLFSEIDLFPWRIEALEVFRHLKDVHQSTTWVHSQTLQFADTEAHGFMGTHTSIWTEKFDKLEALIF
ncbi:disease resistance protein RGA2-like [Hibiscus syriacus]|uniref:disease resistance protein RGA2-like n=1 Tax=Hibiscus syriacus TaxID=106335 RepID=UPI001923F3AE|nr:disease resistance protein RGA2-like [Hibiscus syriacus]